MFESRCPDHKQKKSPEKVAFFVCRLQAISYEHARERVRQQAKGARGCAGERKRMSVAGREQKRMTILLPRESVFDKEAWRDESIAAQSRRSGADFLIKNQANLVALILSKF